MCQRLTYEEFVQKLRKWIIKAAHLPEDYVFFKKKEKTGITANGDRLFVVCAETDSGKDICGIFVEELYQDYVEGTSMENIEARVKCDLDRAGNMENTRYLNDYEKVREHLFLGLLNLEKHRHELKNAVYKTMGDIAITLYVHAGTLKNGITYLKVRSEYLETWGLEKDDVLHDALLNSYRILSPRIYDFKKMMYTPGYAGDDFMNVDSYFISDKKKKEGICLSVKGLTKAKDTETFKTNNLLEPDYEIRQGNSEGLGEMAEKSGNYTELHFL